MQSFLGKAQLGLCTACNTLGGATSRTAESLHGKVVQLVTFSPTAIPNDTLKFRRQLLEKYITVVEALRKETANLKLWIARCGDLCPEKILCTLEGFDELKNAESLIGELAAQKQTLMKFGLYFSVYVVCLSF
eukprot:TRINITY_DN122775_c0_g1_i1.p1 TRINITY_DN122775_c0_g1~~TRINITY_DN122775_c0_g1_i1.p1  ORF type:complete len:133 (+),score=4.50 TRINITY_DN122775_c0_g1_i1:2-400(+)